MADQTLLDFEKGFDFAAVPAQDVTVSEVKTAGGSALRVSSGHKHDWPGITLKAPAGHWDLSRQAYLLVDVKNAGQNAVTVSCRVDNPGADGQKNCNTASINLAPGAAGTLKVTFTPRIAGGQGVNLFGMRGYPAGQEQKASIDTANVTQLVLFSPKPKEDHVWEIDNIRAAGTFTPPPPAPDADKFFPFIDTFGQYIHRDWPGKVHSLEELAQRRAEEAADLKAKPGPAEWNQWGGWAAGPALRATGFFRTEKYQGKWWLVDPDGKLFFSHGIDCVGSIDWTPVDERETWFQEYPGDKPEFQRFAGKGRGLHGHYAGKTPKTFSFIGANLMRKYGPEWEQVTAELAHARLRSWGINTVANWSNDKVRLVRKTPYVATLGVGGKILEGSTGYWGKFKDVFDPSFQESIRARVKEAKAYAGDPWCLGYFVDNEIAWGDETSLAVAALQSPPDQAAKVAFLADLKAKYADIAALNAAWGTAHESWEALLAGRTAPDKTKARADLTAFYTRFAERYFQVIRDAVKEFAPNQLYLGCRFAWVNPLAAAASAKYCDVVSYNLYRRSVADFQFNGGADVPLIIGEFHFGALDRGMFHTGLVSVANQDERAGLYKEYVQGVLRHPQFVGCHWFKYDDEPATGRVLDEENYQIGFLDQVDTPYRETIEASREVGYSLYRYRLAK